MATEKPELRAVPIEAEAEELKKATPEELKKIREEAEADSGVKRNLEDPKYVTALNKGWAKHYGDSHPLSKKILEFKGEGDEKAAMDAVKSIQTNLWFTGEDVDGVISYKTIKAYNAMLERHDANRTSGPTIKSAVDNNIQKIDQLWADEKQEKLKAHAEELTQRVNEGGETEGLADINGKALQVTVENGEKVFIGSDEGENNGKYYNPESGEYESKDERTARVDWVAKEKQWKLSELKAKIDGGQEQELKDLEGNALRVETVDGKKEVMWTGNDKAQMYYDLETGEYQTKEARSEGTKEKQQQKIEDGLKGKIEGQWTKVEGDEYMRVGDEVFRKKSVPNGYRDAGGGSTEDKYEVAIVGSDGKVWEFEGATKEEVDIVKGRREETLKEQESYGDQKDRAIVMERILDQKDRGGIDEKIGDMTIGRIGDIKDNNDLTPAQRRDLQEFGKKAESLGRPDMTIRQYTELVRDPIKAAQEFATTEKGKLPGGLGEYGTEYQKNNTGTILAYREDSELPRILTQDKGEIDIREDIRNRWTNSFVDIGNGRTIMWVESDGKWTYELEEKQKDGKIATRKIKEDGTLEQQSEAPTSVASI